MGVIILYRPQGHEWKVGNGWVKESVHLALGLKQGVNKKRCSALNNASIEGIPKQGYLSQETPNCYKLRNKRPNSLFLLIQCLSPMLICIKR